MGGGGRGMRVVREPGKLADSIESAQREAGTAFGVPDVFLEKFVERAKHIEVQLIGDRHGGLVHLFERDCSIQRRHQKVVEETPCPAASPELVRRMGEVAVRGAQAVGYHSAGTFEFLLGENGEFYFLEMNTRLQVEHPVTELVTGIDLVQWQLRIASGEKLPFRQEDIVPRGWAMECRITSEDASNNFLPSTGRISYLHLPSGPGVRWDGGVESGSEVSLYYDPMLAKLIVWGADRGQAVTRMRRALVDLIVQGVETSRDFHIKVMDDDDFRRGAIDIQWLERKLPDILGKPASEDAMMVAAVAGVLLAERDRSARAVSLSPGSASPASESAALDSWKQAARIEGLRS
jgi:acetyl-CoA carboxylase biotin carboxylase subunit